MSHTRIHGLELRCLHCGDAYEMAPSPPLSVALAAMKEWEKLHKTCKPSEAGAARMRYATPQEWLRSWDTGLSSMAIWNVMMGEPIGREAIPRDPADFGRCYRLLAAIPGWRARLDAMAHESAMWIPFVKAWPELEKLYEEEIPTGKAPKLYAAMCELVAMAETLRQ